MQILFYVKELSISVWQCRGANMITEIWDVGDEVRWSLRQTWTMHNNSSMPAPGLSYNEIQWRQLSYSITRGENNPCLYYNFTVSSILGGGYFYNLLVRINITFVLFTIPSKRLKRDGMDCSDTKLGGQFNLLICRSHSSARIGKQGI